MNLIFTGTGGGYSKGCSGVFYWEQDQGAFLLFGGEDEGHQWGDGRNGQGTGFTGNVEEISNLFPTF